MPKSTALRAIVMSALVFGFVPANARAQTVGEVIGNAFFDSLNGVVGNIPNNSNVAAGFDSGRALTFSGALSSALVVETAGFPIGSSSGGFTYFFDATSGVPVRSSPSFGPAFAERPLTSGRGKLNVGFAYLHRSFSEIEGTDLENGSVKFNSELYFSTPPFESLDIIESTFRLKVKSDTATFFATYGAMDKLDVAVAVPVQHVSVEAAVHSQLVRFGPTSTALPVAAADASDSRDATGVGDVALRAKYSLFNGSRAAVAAGVDIRLATGDEDNLLGTGNTRTKVYVAAASKSGRLFPHANFGYTFKSHLEEVAGGFNCTGESQFCYGSELSYVGGAELVVNPRLTIVGDIVGRSLDQEGRLESRSRTVSLTAVTATYQGRVTFVPAETRTVSDLNYTPGLRLNTALAAIGAKFSPGSTFIVSGHVLFQLTDAGIKSKVTPVIGVDYTF